MHSNCHTCFYTVQPVVTRHCSQTLHPSRLASSGIDPVARTVGVVTCSVSERRTHVKMGTRVLTRVLVWYD